MKRYELYNIIYSLDVFSENLKEVIELQVSLVVHIHLVVQTFLYLVGRGNQVSIVYQSLNGNSVTFVINGIKHLSDILLLQDNMGIDRTGQKLYLIR